MKHCLLFLLLMVLGYFKINAQTLHIYGGEDNKVYLGCLNCDDHNSNSIWNEHGTYGSEHSSSSIWNEHGTYGSEHNQYCPWNEHSSQSPILVDAEGNFYGYFTINTHKSERATFGLVIELYKYHELIRDNVSDWYDKLFE